MSKKKYEIKFTQIATAYGEIEAENAKEAQEIAWDQLANGEIDFDLQNDQNIKCEVKELKQKCR